MPHIEVAGKIRFPRTTISVPISGPVFADTATGPPPPLTFTTASTGSGIQAFYFPFTVAPGTTIHKTRARIIDSALGSGTVMDCGLVEATTSGHGVGNTGSFSSGAGTQQTIESAELTGHIYTLGTVYYVGINVLYSGTNSPVSVVWVEVDISLPPP
mgnify:CR=1 FL=1